MPGRLKKNCKCRVCGEDVCVVIRTRHPDGTTDFDYHHTIHYPAKVNKPACSITAPTVAKANKWEREDAGE